MRLSYRWRAVLLILVASGMATDIEAARARTLGLADMADRAGRIFVGRCLKRAVGEDAVTGLATTEYTFVVLEPIKGVGRGQTSFRVPGTPERPLLPGLTVFHVGEEALVLLYPESPAGFSTAMGLDQGRFRIRPGPDGARQAINGRGNAGLFRDVPRPLLQAHGLMQDKRGPVDLSALKDLLADLGAQRQP